MLKVEGAWTRRAHSAGQRVRLLPSLRSTTCSSSGFLHIGQLPGWASGLVRGSFTGLCSAGPYNININRMNQFGRLVAMAITSLLDAK